MRRFAAVVLGFLVLGALPAAATAGGHQKPMAGACATTFAVSPTGEIAITGVCLLTHLGLTTYRATQTVTPNGDGTVHITVDGVYTAANGDQLHGTISGTGSFSGAATVAYSTTETFVGGTGRFADAHGQVTDTGTAQFTSATTGRSVYTVRGSISY